MARRTATEKAQTHERIVKHAARRIRSGGSAVSIGDVMDELGLTHGGFYRHFPSKDALVVAAVSRAMDEVSERFEAIARKAPPGRAAAEIISAYLSEEHLAHPETWCALAALSGDLGRLPAAVRKQLDAVMGRYLERLSPYMPGASEEERARTFIIVFSGMAGAIAMARAMGDRGRAHAILAATRAYYLQAFGGVNPEVDIKSANGKRISDGNL